MRSSITRTAASWLLALIVAAMIIAADIRFGHAATGVPIGDFYADLQPYIVAVVGSLVMALAGIAVAALTRLFSKLGLDIDARQREALQTALANGGMVVVKKAADEVGERIQDVRIPLGSRAVEIGAEYVAKAAPDALKYFGITPEKVAAKLEPHIARAQAMVTPIVGPSFPAAPAAPAGVVPDTGRVEMSGAAG